MNKIWSDIAWDEYLYWQAQDRKTLKKINELLKDIDRNGYKCKGKPEPLKGNYKYRARKPLPMKSVVG